MNADGSSPHTVLAPQEGPCFKDSPEWSPKGDKIAFVGAADHQASIEGGESIYTVGADGTGVRALPSVSGSDGPAWSPDGTQLAYTIHFSVTPSRESGGALVLSNADGSGARTTAIGVYDPAWSPDGTALAVAVGTFSASNIATFDTFGTKLGDVTQDGPQSIANSYPNWQPIPGPKRSDYKNAAQFCNAERAFLGDAAFKRKYGTNGTGANAFGKCVSSN
jgi:Tol biopolymer transport system component